MAVKDYIFKHPKVCPSDLAVKARAKMRNYKVRALPVLEGDKLVGIITRSDLIKITSTKSNITVGGFLSKSPIKIEADTPELDAARLMRRHKIKQLPVFENGKYLGIARDTDLLRAFLEKGYKPKKKSVRDIMTKKARSFSTDDSLDKVWFALKDHSGFPVIDKKDVVGLITTEEVLSSKTARLSRESGRIKTPPRVQSVMRIIKGEESRFLVKPSTPIKKAAEKMLDTGSCVLPVVDKTLVGVVTKRDILGGYV